MWCQTSGLQERSETALKVLHILQGLHIWSILLRLDSWWSTLAEQRTKHLALHAIFFSRSIVHLYPIFFLDIAKRFVMDMCTLKLCKDDRNNRWRDNHLWPRLLFLWLFNLESQLFLININGTWLTFEYLKKAFVPWWHMLPRLMTLPSMNVWWRQSTMVACPTKVFGMKRQVPPIRGSKSNEVNFEQGEPRMRKWCWRCILLRCGYNCMKHDWFCWF